MSNVVCFLEEPPPPLPFSIHPVYFTEQLIKREGRKFSEFDPFFTVSGERRVEWKREKTAGDQSWEAPCSKFPLDIKNNEWTDSIRWPSVIRFASQLVWCQILEGNRISRLKGAAASIWMWVMLQVPFGSHI